METTDNTAHPAQAQAQAQAQPQIPPTPTANPHLHQTTNNTPTPSKPSHTKTNNNMSLLSPELVSAFRVCIRSYGVGYVFATAPKLIKTLLGFIMNPRKVTTKGQNPVVTLVKTLLTVIKDGTSSKRDGMGMLLMITLGGYKLLEIILTQGIKKAALAQHVQHQQHLRQQQQQMADKEGSTSSSPSLADNDQSTSSLKNLTMKDVDKVNLAEDMQQRITMFASFLSSAAAIVFMHRKRPNHATIDYSLFAVVRALDVFGHVAVKNKWGPRWLGSYGAVAVFVLACTEIMFSWLYEPERLPGPYAFWITKMARMDKRLLETLRAVRTGEVQFKRVNPPHVHNLLTGLCEDIGLNPQMGDFALRSRLPCEVVHQGITKSCEVHTGYRWIQGFMVSTGIYLPVHLLPALLSPKAFFNRLQENPVATVSSTLMATARSSAFLATYIALIWYGICTWRSKVMPITMKLTGKRYTSNVVDHIYGPLLGSFMCGFSVLVEKPHRRAEMALYVLPRAIYSMWSRIMAGRLSRKVEMTGEALMYAVSMSMLLTGMRWKREMVRPSMQGLLGWIVEIKKTRLSRGHGHQAVENTRKGKAKADEHSNGAALPQSAIEDRDALAAIEKERGGI
ncbi:hypothetical protein EC957_007462 [Mortierella hygrophila]|uniref:Transmembrane protein 135 N-terminal domain-containing protein n=1 Tax=Mortierella hygrophila TaxID=979708 RepID=A0A9P6FC38_9FUNG|nr:hypothetical protein EC957_007462 [Mortierella hygrophila]